MSPFDPYSHFLIDRLHREQIELRASRQPRLAAPARFTPAAAIRRLLRRGSATCLQCAPPPARPSIPRRQAP